jgi:hypothetical protein
MPIGKPGELPELVCREARIELASHVGCSARVFVIAKMASIQQGL